MSTESLRRRPSNDDTFFWSALIRSRLSQCFDDTEIKPDYGCNPYQGHARIRAADTDFPLEVLNGRPSYNNILDALTTWALLVELSTTTGKTATASFKHLSPAEAADESPISSDFAKAQFLEEIPVSPGAGRRPHDPNRIAVNNRINIREGATGG